MVLYYVLLPPLSFDALTLLFAVNAIVLLISIELTSTYYGIPRLVANRRKLRTITLATIFLFSITCVIQIMLMLIPPYQNPLSWLSYG